MHCRAPFDVALALHACGNATDYALLAAQRAAAAFVVSPCCVGKLKFSTNVSAAVLQDRTARGRSVASFAANQRVFEDRAAAAAGAAASTGADADDAAPPLEHPRSVWMRGGMRQDGDGLGGFQALARAADYSHVEGHNFPAKAMVAKVRLYDSSTVLVV